MIDMKEGKLRQTESVHKKFVIDFIDGTTSYQLFEDMILEIFIKNKWKKGVIKYNEKDGYIFHGAKDFKLKEGGKARKQLNYAHFYRKKTKIKTEEV